MLAVNVRGPFLGIKHALPLLRKNGGGKSLTSDRTLDIRQPDFWQPFLGWVEEKVFVDVCDSISHI
jgi:hypothetical protein